LPRPPPATASPKPVDRSAIRHFFHLALPTINVHPLFIYHGDLFNLGAVNSDKDRDLVTAAIGFRSRLTKSIDAGVAYEIPMTNDENSLIKERVTVDLVWRF
jgi:hypothetical protein